MRIALIYPATAFDHRYHVESLPIGLLYLAAVARECANAKVEVFDSRHGPAAPPPERLADYDLIGFTAMSMQISTALRLAHRIRRAGYAGPIVFGGPHASVAPEHLREQAVADAIFIGEAEDSFREYLRYLEGKPHRLERVWIRSANGHWTFHPGDTFIADLDSLPFPDRSHYGDVVRRVRTINMTTTRGCPFLCNYCQPTKHILFGKKVRRRSVDNILAEVRDALERFGIRSFSIDDDTFTFDRKTVLDLCARLRPLGLEWSCQSRSDIDRETLEAMRDSGCRLMFVGAESGSQRMLELMNKKNTVEANARFILTCRELGIRTWCNVMVGYPGETRDDLEASLRFVFQTRPDRVCTTQVTPFPGTWLWENHRNDLIVQDWDRMARHIRRPKFRSMRPMQRTLDYYAALMQKEFGEPLQADLLLRAPLAHFLARRRPFLLRMLSERARPLYRFLLRKAQRYLTELETAVAQVQAGDMEQGIARLEALHRRYPRETGPLGHLGWIYLTTGRPEKAAACYVLLLEITPDDAEARRLLNQARQELETKQQATSPLPR
ncbi:MAG: radical SAM protein [Candidatus Sumerlaeia bacterium]|nr:radical SAM protein [Candidatus Sumerlaeia bacterium]